MEYDPHYPTILPEFIALSLVFVLNILIPVSAIFAARRLKRRRWLPHTIAFLWVFFSPLTLAILTTPTMAADEVGGPGGGFTLLPILGETPIVLVFYAIVLLSLRAKRQNPAPSHLPS
ncbi:hypothetical protein R1521_00200 [Rhizobium brockwellii]|jgi:hypothetical protein|uniref:Lycopene cyclase domain-containing protein n=1 Tax=Rhizobium brockwellii TaxID=3019932 RepID=A0ABU3YDJ2_9HYPH|nr:MULTISPECIES: hypothetical protein [Rhizobium]MDV4176932.1 hypothetical protein [Rhizobium brockwellii]MDV4183931.1 hypothetical protein [Rhizobium brockwellii]QIO51273.1 hypothetical protein HA461_08825 [Rhizobium leguminosarum bv. trifolii]TAX35189.1 hypothetical protein ELI06_13175 [Rhizobium leguminosarum]